MDKRATPTQDKPSKPNPLAKVALISAVGVALGLLSNNKRLTDYLAEKMGQQTLQPQVFVGRVHKTLEDMYFVSEQGVAYHIADPSYIIDDIAVNRGIKTPFYELHRVRVKALVSKAGNYGHMGYYEHQLTIVGLATDNS